VVLVAILALGVLPACRGSEGKSEAPEVRSAEGAPALPVTAGSSAATAASPLCLELLAPRARVVLGEPVVLVASLRNCSPKARTVADLLAPEYGFLATFVARPGEKEETRWEAGVVREGRGKKTRTLAPEERLTAWLPISVDRSGWFLTRPGTYRARAELALEGTRIGSNSVTFDVAPASSDADRRAAEIFMRPDVSRALASGGTPSGDAWASLSAVSKEHPQSRHAPYARLVMGVARTRPAFDPKTKSFTRPDCPAAVEDLRWALERLDDPVFAATGTIALSECLDSLGQKGAARETFSSYYRMHPEARRLPGVEDMFESRQYRGN
jgi:hypothetical protein